MVVRFCRLPVADLRGGPAGRPTSPSVPSGEVGQ